MEMLAAIRSRRAQIAQELEALAIEDQQLATTEQVLSRLKTRPASAKSETGRREALRTAATGSTGRGQPRTQREYVLEALAQSPEAWLRTSELVAFVKTRWGHAMPELSLRPLMTKLKKEGAIARSGRLVALRSRSAEPKPRLRAR